MATRRERRLGFLARSYSRMLDNMARVTKAFVEQPDVVEREMPRLLKSFESLAESLTNLMEMGEGKYRPHRRPNAQKRDA